MSSLAVDFWIDLFLGLIGGLVAIGLILGVSWVFGVLILCVHRRLGRVAPAGMKAFERRTSHSGKYSFESRPKKFPPAYEKRFKNNRVAWEFFCAQAPWYQRTATFWVVSAKQEETRQRRLKTLITDSASGRRLGVLTPKVKAAARKQKTE